MMTPEQLAIRVWCEMPNHCKWGGMNSIHDPAVDENCTQYHKPADMIGQPCTLASVTKEIEVQRQIIALITRGLAEHEDLLRILLDTQEKLR